ncbi:MAG: DUF2625 family protein [Clostridia bacterium]|nr:DUF2625 family protein [Clostridia bacterium]
MCWKKSDDKWKEIKRNIDEAENTISINYSEFKSLGAIDELKINPQSTLGSFLQHIDSFVVNGYLRMTNGNINRAGNIATITGKIREQYGYEKIMVIANDIWGGFFAINNGELSNNIEEIWYFSPDTLGWENTEKNYTEFLEWVCSGDVEYYYSEWMWDNMENEIKDFSNSDGIFTYPFLWADEYELTTAKRNRAPWFEITGINAYYLNQMNN